MDFAARGARELYNRWRGFQPWPGAFTFLNGKKLIVHRMAPVHESSSSDLGVTEPDSIGPGSILIENGRMLAACADNTWLEFQEVQLEGKKRMPVAEFLRGNPLPPGTRLG
jgi:methionyl-tRNA formyltransferase